MKILMITCDLIIDRRILLEAESLIKAGHQVSLIAPRTHDDHTDNVNDIGINTYYYFLNASTIFYDAQWLKRQIESLECSQTNLDSKIKKCQQLIYTFRLERTMIKLSKTIKNQTLAKILLFLLFPSYALDRINQLPLPNKIKYPSTLFFALLSLSPKKILAALKFNKKHGDQMNSLDYWEQDIIDLIAKYSLDFDVIHTHDYQTLKVATVIKQRHRKTLIYDAHELYGYQPSVPKLIKPILLRDEKKFIQYCDHTIVINDSQADIMKKDLSYSNFTPITNATHPPKAFDVNTHYDWIREKCSLTSNDKLLIFQGAVNRHRKIDILINGLAKTPENIHLTFLTAQNSAALFKSLIDELKLGNRIHFLPQVPWDEVIYWAASADAGIMPYQPDDLNTKISSPNKMYEFITAGIPMIASSGLVNVKKAMEEDGLGVLYDLRVADDYAAAINEMFDESLGGPTRFRENILQHRHKYLWAHEEKKLLEFYKTLETSITQEDKHIPQPASSVTA